MSASNQQTLAESGATDRPPILEKGNYIPWETKEGESLESAYERLSTLVNVMDRNDVRPIKVSINTKFLNSLQPEWSKYVTLTRQNKILSDVEYDALYDDLLELQGDAQENKLTTAMMLLARAITQKFSTPTNNRLRTSSNIRNQDVIHDGRVDIQTKNASYGGNGNRNAGRQNRNQAVNAGSGQVQQIDESNLIVQRASRTELNPGRVR
ncbi:hypothetical protein Tco_0566018 [Tanacetum coccineum]